MTPVLTLTRPCDEEVYLPEALAAAAMLHRTYGHARWLLLERRTRVLDLNRTLVPDPERVAAAHRALARHEAAALVVRPRELVVDEPWALVDGEPMAAAILDVTLAAWHAARTARPLRLLPPPWHEPAEGGWWDALVADAARRAGLPPRSIAVTASVYTEGSALDGQGSLVASEYTSR